MISDYFLPEIEDIDVEDMWFQQDREKGKKHKYFFHYKIEIKIEGS